MCKRRFCCCCCFKKQKKEENPSGEETMINEQSYRYLTGEEMKGFGDDSAPIDVTRDERCDVNTVPPTSIDDAISPQTVYDSYSGPVDNIDIVKYPPHVGFLVSFLVDARGGAMRGCRHSGVRVIVPPRRASMPTRVTCRYLRREKLLHPPPLMEGESLASRILELGPVGAKFLGPVMIEVPNFGSLRGSEREIVILRSDNGETWREHTVEVTDEVVKDILGPNFDKEDRDPWHSGNRLTRIVTTEFPHYFAVVSRVKQEVHAIGPEGGMVSSTVVPQVQAVFPQGALTKRIKVGLQAQPIPSELTAKLLGNRVAVSPIVTVEPRRRKFHKPITLTLPLPQAATKGMINHYSGDAPTLRLLCSITGGTSRAQWEDVTGSTPLTFINDCVSFTTTVSARFWLMDCRNVADASKMATELYREAIHVPFMAKFVVFAKRTDTNEARIRLFCMTDDREDKTLEHKEQFTEVSNSRDVEVLEGKPVYVEFAGNLVPVTKSGEQLRLVVRAFKENRLPFTMRVKDPGAEPRSWTIVMKEPKVSKNEAAQTPVCVLQFGLPDNIVPDTDAHEDGQYNYTYVRDPNVEYHKHAELRITDISNFVSDDWIKLAHELGFQSTDIAQIQKEHPDSSGQQCMSMLNLWLNEISAPDSVTALERALNNIGRDDIVEKCNFAEIGHYPSQHGVHAQPEQIRDRQRRADDKYAAEEKAVVEDEIVKTVTERRMEIEQRLTGGEPVAVVVGRKQEPPSADTTDDADRRWSSEAPAEPIEPTEASFEHKRLSFERGVSIEQVLQEDVPVAKDRPVASLDEKKMPSIEEQTADGEVVDATSLTFHEKRLSFEQGIPVKEILILKKTEETGPPGLQRTIAADERTTKEPADDTTKSTVVVERETSSAGGKGITGEKPKPNSGVELIKETNEQTRRDSLLFEEVSQGLEKLDATGLKVEDRSGLLSPQSSKTPPPSPAEFKKGERQDGEPPQESARPRPTETERPTGDEANHTTPQNAKSINSSENDRNQIRPLMVRTPSENTVPDDYEHLDEWKPVDYSKISPDTVQEKLNTMLSDPGNHDETLTNFLIDMLIEQETAKLAASGELSSGSSDSDPHETPDVEPILNCPSPIPIISSPKFRRNGVGGSQRLSTSQRPTLSEIQKFDSESDNENEYIVTEPQEKSTGRKVTFRLESEDDEIVYPGQSDSDNDVEDCDESISTINPNSSIEDMKFEVDANVGEKTLKRVERRFERMASETLEDSPIAKQAVEGEYHRIISQLSNEEVEVANQIWDGAGSSEETQRPSTSNVNKELQVAASKPELKCEISMDDDTEIDPREHDWRFQHQINTETDDTTKPSTSAGWTGKTKPKENVSEL